MAAYLTFIMFASTFGNILWYRTFVSAEQLTVAPQQSFLHDNQSITLLWRYQSEDLTDSQFSQNFIFYYNGEQLDTERGGATKTYPGKSYVDYELKTRKPGTFVGEVGQLKSTAHVYGVSYEAEVLAAKSGSNLKLKCEGGPDSAVKSWQVDGAPVDQAGLETFFVTYDGSLLVQNIDFNDALKKISCRQFFSEEDRDQFRTNSLAILVYKTALTTKPILVYETVEKSDSTYMVQVGTWKEDVMIRTCSQQDGKGICEETTANTTAELDRKHSNFTIIIDNMSVVSGSFKGSEEPVDEKVQPDESDGTVGIIVGVILGILVVAGVLIFLVIVQRKRKPCFMETAVSKEDQAGMKPLVPKVEKNVIQDAVELKELEKKEPPDEKQPALEELEAMEDEEVNPLLLDNYKKKEVVEPETYKFGQPKYLKNKYKTTTDGEDKPDAKTESEEEEKQIEKESYDLLKEIDVQQSWDQFKLFATKIDDFLETRLKLPEKPGSDISGSLYMNGKDILPRGFVSYVSSSKGDCLFNSVSSVLYGDEFHTNRLRLAALLDGINKWDFYVKQYFKDKEKDDLKFLNSCLSDESIKQLDTSRQEETGYLAEFIVQMAVKEMSVPDSKCNPLQVQFLSSAIDLPVLQYFQKGYQDFYGRPVKDYEVVKPAGMVGSVKGQNKDCVFVLWVCESQKLYIDGGRLDYIVPVLKKIHKQKDT